MLTAFVASNILLMLSFLCFVQGFHLFRRVMLRQRYLAGLKDGWHIIDTSICLILAYFSLNFFILAFVVYFRISNS